MIPFKPVELADKATIEAYTHKSECRNCDMSFANIYCWRHFHRSHWAVVDGFLVIRFLIDEKRQVGYMQPIGEGDFSHILPQLAQDSWEQFGQRLRLHGLCREGRKCITECGEYPFAYDDDRSLSDYIYLAEDLRTLSGRKYQPKRNHLNRFMGNYSYRYEDLTEQHFEECLRLEAEWRAARTSEDDSEAMRHEQRALREAFDHWAELELKGGVLYVEDRLVAFTYGSAINYDTFDCHVEKADTHYEGVFAAINKLFAEHLDPQFTYINREEDMGLEGLRRSKLSYYPTLLWPKTTAILLHDDEQACRRLWMEAFGDEEVFVDRFLIRHYRQERMLSIEEEGNLCSMLHLIPFQSGDYRIGYLYGVATAPEKRGRGYASTLIRQAIEKGHQEGLDGLMLIPADEDLRTFYGRFGFAGDYPIRLLSRDDFDFGTGDAERDRAMLLALNPIDTEHPILELVQVD